MSGKPSDQEGLFVVLSIHKSVCKRIYRFSKPIIFDKIREEKTHWNSIVSWITWRDLVQLVKIGVQSRGMGRYILNVVCFFLCPDADCLRNNLSNWIHLHSQDWLIISSGYFSALLRLQVHIQLWGGFSYIYIFITDGLVIHQLYFGSGQRRTNL